VSKEPVGAKVDPDNLRDFVPDCSSSGSDTATPFVLPAARQVVEDVKCPFASRRCVEARLVAGKKLSVKSAQSYRWVVKQFVAVISSVGQVVAEERCIAGPEDDNGRSGGSGADECCGGESKERSLFHPPPYTKILGIWKEKLLPGANCLWRNTTGLSSSFAEPY
jgi:hypothetical protein